MRPHMTLSSAMVVILLTQAHAQESASRTDFLSFAQGTLPLTIETGDADFRTGHEQTISAIDGNPIGFVMTPRFGAATDTVEITYALPAPTLFDRFAVPQVLETPSPSQTFFKNVEVLGSAESPDGPYVTLAIGELTEHDGPGLETELALTSTQTEVRWVRLRLSDGLDVQREQTFFEFSEIIGNGAQQANPQSDLFNGVWEGRGVDIELAQDGASVTGCYDGMHQLTGTVDGTVLRALGADSAGIPSQFILIANESRALHGLRSTNGAPFRIYDGEASSNAPMCLPVEAPALGCGSIVHGINFDFDSDTLRPDSEAVLDALFEGLSTETSASITIIGHSSSEGADDYNRDLSQRRAASVVAALATRGLDTGRMSADGRGEDEPIASNDDEAGRSLNRRVEVMCSG